MSHTDVELDLTGAQRATIDSLLHGEAPIEPPEWPTALRMWMSHGGEVPARYDLSRLRLLACAGEPLNPQAHRWAQQYLVSQGYWSQIPGCYSAGDVAVRDEDGWLAVLGRADDVMNVAGHRIGTADVEGSLLRHPAVAESAVIGLPDSLKGEKIAAYVVLKAGFPDTPGLRASLKDHVREDLGPISQPSEIEIVAGVPKTRSGKIVRRYLKALALGEDPGDLSTLAD